MTVSANLRPQRYALLVAALLVLAASAPATASATLRIDLEPAPRETRAEAGAGARAEARTRALVERTLERLPPRWRNQDRAYVLAWRDDLPDGVHGRIRGRRIALSNALLETPEGSGPQPDDLPGDAAIAALVHELAHAWDRDHGLSRDARLLDLAGWQERPLWPGRSRTNAFSGRSPDRYELHSPAEFVAVNLEHFLLDPGYACRRPMLHAWFADHFDWAPASTPCTAALPWVDAGALADAGAEPLLELEPSRVFAVDYLLAGDGQAMASRWGHAMLRLVICAPGRAPGPDCRLDLDHHRVLSFRAFVDDLQRSSWRGLTGGYPSRLFVLPLQQVVDEYTRVESRPLDAIPLRLSQAEVGALLQRAARVHWSYDGRYRFIGNNCAVETWKLLQEGLPRAAEARLDSITPKGLLRRLRRAGLVDDAQVPGDPAEALRLGYRFEPMDAHYQALYDVARAGPGEWPDSVGAWLLLPPAARAPAIGHADMRSAAALLLLEEAALTRAEHLARDLLKRRLARVRAGARTAGQGADSLPALIEDALREGRIFASPAQLVSLPGYGIPQSAERAQARHDASARAQRLRALDKRLHAAARTGLPERHRATLEQTEANIATLGRRLRALHEAAGDFTLPARSGDIPRP